MRTEAGGRESRPVKRRKRDMASKAYEQMASCVIEELKKRNMEWFYSEDSKTAADLVCSLNW